MFHQSLEDDANPEIPGLEKGAGIETPSLDPKKRRTIKRAASGKHSRWLTVIPVAHEHFDLSPTEFRDALALRFNRVILKIPAFCDACGVIFNLQHTLDCKKGGLVTLRHNEVRDALGDTASMAYKDVVREPIVREANDSLGMSALIADLGVRGVWQPQTEALFDIRVVDTDAQSYTEHSVEAVLSSAEQAKKTKFTQAAELRRAFFSPFVISVDGLMGCEALSFTKRLSEKLFYR